MTGMSFAAAFSSWPARAVPSTAAMTRMSAPSAVIWSTCCDWVGMAPLAGAGPRRGPLFGLLRRGRDVVVGGLQVDGVPLCLQLLLDVVTVGDPALGGLGRHRDTDGQVLRLPAAARPPAPPRAP